MDMTSKQSWIIMHDQNRLAYDIHTVAVAFHLWKAAVSSYRLGSTILVPRTQIIVFITCKACCRVYIEIKDYINSLGFYIRMASLLIFRLESMPLWRPNFKWKRSKAYFIFLHLRQTPSPAAGGRRGWHDRQIVSAGFLLIVHRY